MKRSLAIAVVAIAAVTVVVILLRQWSVSPNTVPAPVKLSFAAPGMVRAENVQRFGELQLCDATGRVLAQSPTFGRPSVDLLFAWEPGKKYRLLGDGVPVSVGEAPPCYPEAIVRVHLPVGQAVYEYPLSAARGTYEPQQITVACEAGETIDLALEIERLVEGRPLHFQVTARYRTVPEPSSSSFVEPAVVAGRGAGKPASDSPAERPVQRSTTGRTRLATTGGFSDDLVCTPPLEHETATVEHEFDKWLWTGQLRVGDRVPLGRLDLDFRSERFAVPLRIGFEPRQFDPGSVRVTRWLLPTDATGRTERSRAEDRIVLPNRFWARVARWLGAPSEVPNYYEPFTFQTLWIENRSSQPLGLLLRAEVVDHRGQPVPYFASAQLDSTGGTRQIIAYGYVAAGATERFVLPIYVRPGTPEGNFQRRVEIRLLGSDRVVRVLQSPLGVVRSHAVYSLWLVGTATLSVAWLAGTVLFYRRMVRSFGVRLLVLLSLLGSLQFAVQLAGRLVLMLFYAVLGPFNCLVGGLLTEVTTYLLVTSILYLVPRVGAMTLAGLVTYLAGGIMFGSFGILDFLFIGSSIAFRELLLAGFGVTRFRPTDKPPRLLPMMLSLGLADAATSFTSLVLQAVFYRLFFANWYIFLQVVVTGFLYTALGVWLGRSLGVSLRRVHP